MKYFWGNELIKYPIFTLCIFILFSSLISISVSGQTRKTRSENSKVVKTKKRAKIKKIRKELMPKSSIESSTKINNDKRPKCGGVKHAITNTPIEYAKAYQDTIYLDSIDVNANGIIYQDFFDPNVMADTTAICPICEKDLQRVTIDDAKKALLWQRGFIVK